MLKTRKRVIASIVSVSMMFSLIGPNLILADGSDQTEPFLIEETTLPSDETDETTETSEETTLEETSESEEPADSEDPENPEDKKSSDESTEETADPTDDKKEGTTESSDDKEPTEPTKEENKEPTEESSEPKETEPEETKPEETKPEEKEPEETEPPKRGAAKGPTRGEVEVIPGGVANTAEAGLDACALIYYASATDTDHYVMEIREGNQTKSTSYGDFVKSYPIGLNDVPWAEDAEIINNITLVRLSNQFKGRTSFNSFFKDFVSMTTLENPNNLFSVDSTDFSHMFENCQNLTLSSNIGYNFYTTNGTDFSYMFYNCKLSTGSFSIDVARWDTSNGTTFSNMFVNTQTTSLDLSGLDLENATNLVSMITGNSRLTSLTANNFNFASISDSDADNQMAQMIAGNSSVTTMYLNNWSNLPENFTHVFGRKWQAANRIDVNNWDLTGVKSLCGLFPSNTITDIRGMASWANATSLEDVSQMFMGCQDDGFNVSALANSPLTNTSTMFMDCTNMTSITGLTSLDTSNVTNMMAMFNNCSKMTTIDCSGWNTANVETMSGMFYGCTKLTTVKITDFDFSSIDTTAGGVYGMFGNCPAITSIDASNVTIPDGLLSGNEMGIVTNTLLSNGTYPLGGPDDTNEYYIVEPGVYEKVTKILYLDYNGGTDPNYMPEAIYITASHTTAEVLPQPTKGDLVFGGWYKAYTTSTSDNLANYEILPTTVLTNNSNYPANSTFYAHYANPGTRFGVLGRGSYSSNGGNVYTLIYDSGVAVVQKGNTPDPQYGTVLATNLSTNTDLVNTGWDSYDITKIIIKDTIDNISSMEYAFARFDHLTEIEGLENLLSGNVTDFDFCFDELPSLETLDISGLDMSSATSTTGIVGDWEGCATSKIILGEKNKFNGASLDSASYWCSEGWVHNGVRYSDPFNNYTSARAGEYVLAHKFTFYPMGGRMSGDAIKYYTEDGFVDGTTTFEIPTKNGCTFLGWYDGDGIERTSFDPTVDTFTSVFAKWETGSWTLVIKPNGAEGNDITIDIPMDETYKLSSDIFTRNGYKLQNFTTNANGSGTYYNSSYVFGSNGAPVEEGETLTIYAQWIQLEEVEITYHFISLYDSSTLFPDKSYTLETGTSLYDTSEEIRNADYGEYLYLYILTEGGCDYLHWNLITDPSGNNGQDNRFYRQSGGFDYGTNESYSYVYNYFYDQDNYNSSGTVTSDMDGADYYVYMLPKPHATIYFSKEMLEQCPDVKLVVNGQEYASGEFTFFYSPSFSWGSGYSYEYFINTMFSTSASNLYYEFSNKYGSNPVVNKPYYIFYNMGNASMALDDNFYVLDHTDSGIDFYRPNYNNKYSDYLVRSRNIFENETKLYLNFMGKLNIDANGGQFSDGTTETYRSPIQFGTNSNIDLHHQAIENQSYQPTTALYGANMYGLNRDGYIFDGFWTEPEGGEMLDYEQIGSNYYVFADLTKTYYAHWIVKPEDVFVTVSFDSNGGSAVGDCVVEAGQPLSVYPVLTKDNFNFIGWYTEDGIKWDSTSPVLADMTLYAHWSDSFADVTWESGGTSVSWAISVRPIVPGSSYGGSGTAHMQVPVGATVSVLPLAKRTNYDFKGWYTEPDGQGTQVTADTVITGDVTFYGYWETSRKHVDLSDISYNYDVRFTNAGSNDLIASTHSLIYTAEDYTTTLANPNLHIFFDVELQENEQIDTGSVRIKIPYTMDKYGGVQDWGNIPRYPDAGVGMYFSYEEHRVTDATGNIDYENSYYLLINNAPLTGGLGINADITYGTSGIGNYVGGDIVNGEFTNGKTHFDQFDRNVELLYSPNGNDPVTLETDTFHIEFHSHLRLNPDVCSLYGDGSFMWNTSWGAEPEDAEDYFYVVWVGSAGTLGHDSGAKFTLENMVSQEQGAEFVKVLDVGSTYSGVSGRQTNYKAARVLYRYPMSLVDPEAENVIVHMNGEIWAHPVDSFDSYLPVSGSATVTWNVYHFDKAPFNITRNYDRFISKQVSYANDSWMTLYGGTNSGNQDLWSIGYEAIADSMTDPDTGKITYLNYDISMGQKEGDWVYSSGVGGKYYNWDPPTGNYTIYSDNFRLYSLTITGSHYDTVNMEDEDIRFGNKFVSTDSVEVDIYVLFDRYGWIKMDSVSLTNGSYTYNFPNQGYDGGPMLDYAKILGYRVESSTEGHFYTKIDVKPRIYIQFSQNIRNRMLTDIAQDVHSCIKADAEFARGLHNDELIPATKFLDSTGVSATYNIYELTKLNTDQNYNINARVDGPTLDNVNQTQTVTLTYTAHHATTDVNESYAFTRGTFYVLLPEGATYNNVVLKRACATGNNATATQFNSSSIETISPQYYTYEYVENFNNLGIPALVVTFELPETNSTKNQQNHVSVSVDITRTNNDIFAYGRNADSYCMFEDNSTTIPAYKSIYIQYGNFPKNYYYDNVYNPTKDSRTVFASTSFSYNAVTAFTWGFNAYVANDNEGIYTMNIDVIPGDTYTYRLTYGQSSETKVRGIKLVDKLDGIGKLVDVAIPVLHGIDDNGDAVDCTPIVLYNTNPNPDYDNIDTAHGWTETMPVGEVCYAISFDYTTADNGREFRYDQQKFFDILIHQDLGDYLGEGQFENVAEMRADKYEVAAPNNIISYHSTSVLNINLPDMEIHKTSNPVSGTVDDPTVVNVGDEITYTITVTNNEDRAINDVIISDPIGSNLTYKNTDIKLGNLVVGESTPNIEVISETSDLISLKIKTLAAGSTVTITIKAKVVAQGSTTVVNTAYIDGYNDVDLISHTARYTSETTYHMYNTMPDPTGVVINAMPYALVFMLVSVVFIISKKRKRRYN